MENNFLQVILEQGAWAVLFVWLLIDTRKEAKKREESLREVIDKNQEVISELAEKFKVVEGIKDDVQEIKLNLKGEI